MNEPWKERPIFPGKRTPYKKVLDERGVSPVIAVILMVAITVVLAAVLYVMVSGIIIGPNKNITLSMNWQEKSDEPGNYTGYVIKIMGGNPPSLEDVTVVIVNGENIKSKTLGLLKKSDALTVGTVTVTFFDIDENDRLGAEDIFIAKGVTEGNIIRLTHKDAGEMHAQTF